MSIHHEKSNPVFGDGTIHVSIEDECAGPFIVLTDLSEGAKEGEVRLDLDELELVVSEARKLIANYPSTPNA